MVKILASADGKAFVKSANYDTNGKLMVMAVEESIAAPTGFGAIKDGYMVRQQRKIAFVTATQEQFDAIFKAEGITPAGGVELPGVIQVIEQLTPFSATNPESGIKYPNAEMKKLGKACTVNGAPVYRKTTWLPDGDETVQDILVPHDNGAQIQEFIRSMNAANKANTPALAGASPVQR